MAWEDYIPNFFGGTMPSYLPGLLGEQESAALQQRAKVQGLLGAALTLAQGMSPSGPRRSAAQNILSSVAGGLSAGQGAYEGAAQNLMMQQKIAESMLERRKAQNILQAQEEIAKEDPALARLFALAPTQAAGVYGDLLQSKMLERYRPTMATPQQPMAQPQIAPPMPSPTDTGEATAYPVPAPVMNAGEAPVQPTNVTIGEKMMPPVEVTAPKVNAIAGNLDNLLSRRNYLQEFKANLIMSAPATQAVSKKIEELDKGIEQFNKQISIASAASIDLDNLKKSAPAEFAPRIAALETGIYNESMNIKDAYDAVKDLQKDIFDYQTKQRDFTNDVRRVAKELFPNKQLTELTGDDLAKLNAEIDKRDIAKRKAGATTINLPSESERTAGFLTNRVVNSMNQLQAAVGANPTAASPNFGSEAIKFLTGSEYLKNLTNPESRQRVEAAQLEILDAALTLGTGAAYTREQLENYRRSYFPQLGDKPETIKDKQQRLKALLDSAMIKSGRAAPNVAPVAPTGKASPSLRAAPQIPDANTIQQELDRRKGKQ